MKLKQILNQIKIKIPRPRKTSYLDIKKIAIQLYNNRQITGVKGTKIEDRYQAEKIANSPLRLVLFKCNQPLIKIEKKFLEPVLDYLNRLALIEILGLVGNLSILLGLIIFIAGEKDRRNSEIYQAWQVITAAHGQKGSGGRKEALEFLNSKPRRNPWFWLTWEEQSLSGLEAPKAYLNEIQLSNAVLSGANLQEADLWQANLQKANLWGANLQKANLVRANFQKANLVEANFQKAVLREAKLQKAVLRKAKLQKAVLIGANLQEAVLWKAKLQKAVLIGANLQEANLWGANLQEANLRNANFKNAMYTDKSTLEAVCDKLDIEYPCPTIFPENFNPKTAGMKLIKESKDIPKDLPWLP
ncbi:MAG: pentapeptide repeat-containing protein [Moorea sp. SIOASIH]|uniref:pentapeptide repeat-containing protein n=1 Tax=Moorena sp. SIOASIH TaxID=2607817 RepID=UPI0013B7AA34|nr:pentapeptide repeat-containing protein [Moorena sp. SIOASIH]NEO41558.1 pentapeptide repeat-containing protein [Moorena sp. SIOASIH]